MADEIRQDEVLTDEEKQLLFGWRENIFDLAALKLSWRAKHLHLLLYADGEPVSHVGVLKDAVPRQWRAGYGRGVGRVVTVPGAEERISSPPHAAYGGIL